jgi:hypothetical protein
MAASRLRLYAPFLALALVQALIITVAPSTGTGPGQEVAFAEGDAGFEAGDAAATVPGDGGAGGTGDGEPLSFDEVAVGEEGAADDTGTFPEDPGAPVGDGAGGAPQTAEGAGGEEAAGSGPDAGDGGGEPTAGGDGATAQAAAAAPDGGGDRSHCTDDGRQHGVVVHAPPCQPTWPAGADNGGATYRGVTGDEVRIVFFREQKNQHVERLLNQEGLARTVAEEEAFLRASEEFLNKHYETYGRKVKLILHLAEECPETPPDIPACRREAQRIVEQHQPFMVLWPVPLYPDVFDVFARNQVIAIGGWHHDARYFNDRRPYRYDVFMDGTRTAEMTGEYYCKKLANGSASHAGRVIHASIGTRDTPRKLGIITPEGDAYTGPAQRLIQIVSGCDAQPPVLVRYQSDIERAQSQAAANIQALIDAGATTVVCLCDPIAPIFRTLAMTQQRYYPEHLLAGSGLLDYDKLGRLYEPSQWAHAFGPSHLGAAIPHRDTDASKVWRDVGRSGDPCLACNLPWSYYQLAGAMIQNAGPNLTPQTVERGTFAAGARGSWQETGGRADVVMASYGPGDHTGVANAREVYWSPSARSGLDNRAGAYVAVDRGRRYEHGQWPTAFAVPAAPQ